MNIPPKPRKDSPCNGCGQCCVAELCFAAEIILGKNAVAPCPLLRWADGRMWCSVVIAEKAAGTAGAVDYDRIAIAIGIGRGCQVEDAADSCEPLAELEGLS